ncbi:MAG: hypothetical protein JWL81_1836 [Verrucomicrobiales bacterium]|nr:hypothetical protein [Verrucomicrobiales bacterium]
MAALVLLSMQPASAKVVEYDLTIAESTVSPAGKPVTGLTINGTIPGPVLEFTEGDWARIRVHNKLPHHSTSTHWHGLLLPNAQDGVPEVTTPSIEPGTTHTFEFPLIQSGTYWYHSHTHLQEQQGIYGPIVIHPKGGATPAADREQTLIISDWTNENPNEVLRSLLRGTEWYSLKKGTTQSLLGAWKAGAVGAFFERERTRMRPMDLSDIAYDAFLINGRSSSTLTGNAGEKIRLRLINGSASTYSYITSSTGPLTLVAADGKPVKPVAVDRLLMAIGETYDAIITLPPGGQYEIRATAQDGSGHASAYIGTGPLHAATDPPAPDLYHMDHMLDAALDEAAAVRAPRPSAPYPLLRSTSAHPFPAKAKWRDIPLRLTGDMERYVWSFNGKTMTEESVIPVRKGEFLRLELVNDTMMHHPIHLHGFYFRLVNGNGTRSPLKHTVDVPPMGRRTLEFQANEVGDWMFHCHLLYHMMAGMSRVVSVKDGLEYSTPSNHVPLPPDMDAAAEHGGMAMGHGSSHHGGIPSFGPEKAGVRMARDHGVNLGEHAVDPVGLWGMASIQSHFTEGLLTMRQGRNDYNVLWEAGWQDVDDMEYEIDAVVERYYTPNFRAFAGARLTNDSDAENRAIAGLRYRLPYLIHSYAALDSQGDVRLGLAKSLQLTPRLSAFGKMEYDTGTDWEWAAGAEYVLTKAFSLTAEYHSDFGMGGGIIFRF